MTTNFRLQVKKAIMDLVLQMYFTREADSPCICDVSDWFR